MIGIEGSGGVIRPSQGILRGHGIILRNTTMSLDSDAKAFIGAQGITDTASKRRINELVKGLKAISLWSNMIFVGGRSGHGPLAALGGNASGVANWTRVGTTTLGANGISFLDAATFSSQPNYVANHLAHTSGQQPLIIGTLYSSGATSGTRVNAARWPIATNSTGAGAWISNGSTGNTYGAQTLLQNGCAGALYTAHNGYVSYASSGDPDGYLAGSDGISYVSGYRNSQPTLQALEYKSATNGSQIYSLVNERRQTGVITAGNQSTPSTTTKFLLATDQTNAGTWHGGFMWSGLMTGTGWNRLFSTLLATYLPDLTASGELLQIHVAGQSNAAPDLASWLNEAFNPSVTQRSALVTNAFRGGQSITYWVGSGTPARTTRYKQDFADTITPGYGIFERTLAPAGIGHHRPVIVWMQGESDNADPSQFLARLRALASFWVADFGTSLRCVLGLPASTDGATNSTNQDTIRAAIATVAAENGWTTADSSGCTRDAGGVHMTVGIGGGYSQFATAIKAAYDSKWP